MSRRGREDAYGTMHAGPESHWYRPRLWARALDRGCLASDLAEAYGVSAKTVTRYAREWRRSTCRGT